MHIETKMRILNNLKLNATPNPDKIENEFANALRSEVCLIRKPTGFHGSSV